MGTKVIKWVHVSLFNCQNYVDLLRFRRSFKVTKNRIRGVSDMLIRNWDKWYLFLYFLFTNSTNKSKLFLRFTMNKENVFLLRHSLSSLECTILLWIIYNLYITFISWHQCRVKSYLRCGLGNTASTYEEFVTKVKQKQVVLNFWLKFHRLWCP